MSRRKKGAGRLPRQERPRVARTRLAAAALLLCVVCAGAAATRWAPARRLVGLAPLYDPAAQQQALPLSKEYVYAGGRLVATEEPTPAATPAPTPAGPAPSALAATGFFPTSDTAAVRLVWSAPPSPASPTGYVVERASARDQNGLVYAPVGSAVTTLPTQANPYVDQTAAAGGVYLYRVKAVYAGGYSGYSNQDLATTVRYTGDDPLVAGASRVRAADLTELRAVVDSVRGLAGVGDSAWKGDPAPASGGSILAAHFVELRSNLNPALSALGITTLPSDATLAVGLPVKAVHVQDVRDKVR